MYFLVQSTQIFVDYKIAEQPKVQRTEISTNNFAGSVFMQLLRCAAPQNFLIPNRKIFGDYNFYL